MKKLSKVTKKKYGAGGPAAIPYRGNTGITKDMANAYAYGAIGNLQSMEAAKEQKYQDQLSSAGNYLKQFAGTQYGTGGVPCEKGFYRDFNTGNCIPLVDPTIPGADPNGALYGAAGQVGGYFLRKGTDDNNAATVTKGEKIGNVGGSMLESAGQGAALGAMFGPQGALIGAGAGALLGAVKGTKENKLAEKEAYGVREDAVSMGVLNREAMLASSMPNQTGFGYNSSTNMNMQPTNYFANAKLGGVRRYGNGGGMSLGDLYNSITAEYNDYLAGPPEAWNEDPSMVNPEGGLNMCLDCHNVNWNSKEDVLDVARLINEGYSTGFHEPSNLELLKSKLSEYQIPEPKYKSVQPPPKKRYGGIKTFGIGGFSNGCKEGETWDPISESCLPNWVYDKQQQHRTTCPSGKCTEPPKQIEPPKQEIPSIGQDKPMDLSRGTLPEGATYLEPIYRKTNIGSPGNQVIDGYTYRVHIPGDQYNPRDKYEIREYRFKGDEIIWDDAKRSENKYGGIKQLPGGIAKQIPGSDAVKFEGKSHAQGGIKLDATTEVEGGETMDKVYVGKNKPLDYFFSKFLKLGGKSFAKRHEEILKSNLPESQKQGYIQNLAKMQEEKAGRDSNAISTSGITKYELAGVYKKKPKVKQVSPPNDYTGTYTSDYVATNDIPQITIQEYYTDTEKTTGNPKEKQPYFALYDNKGYEIARARNKEEAIQKRDQFYNLYEEDKLNMDDPDNPYSLARGRYNYIQGFGVDVQKNGEEYTVTDNSTGKTITTTNPNRVDRFSNRRLRKFNSRNDLHLDAKELAKRDASGEYGELISEKDGYQIRSNPYTQTITETKAPTGKVGWDVSSSPNQFPYRVFNKIGSNLEDYVGNYYDDYDQTNEGLTTFLDKDNPKSNQSSQQDYKIPGLDALNQPERIAFQIQSGSGYETLYKEKNGKYRKWDEANQTWVDVNPSDYSESTYNLYTPPTVAPPTTADEWLTQNNTNKDELYTGLKDQIDNFHFSQNPNDPKNLPSTDLKDNKENWIPGAWRELVGTEFGDLIGLNKDMSEDDAKKAYDETWKSKVDEVIADPARFELLKNFFDYYINNGGDSAKAVKNAFGNKDVTTMSAQDIQKVLNNQMKDGKFGPFHRSLISFMLGTNIDSPEPPADPTIPEYEEPEREGKKPCPDGYYPDIKTGECVKLPDMEFTEEEQSLVPALAQLIPVGYRLATPYKKERGIPANVLPERVTMGRVNLNRDRQMAAQAYAAGLAATKSIAGPGSIAGIQALNSKLSTELGNISDKESKINTDLNTKEVAANADISSRIADLELKRQSFNSANRKEEERYRIERIESGLDAAAERITGIIKDEKLDRFNRDLTRVLDNTHSYDRYTIYKQILAHSKMKDSPFYGKSDAQLRKIAAAYAKEIYGDLQIVSDARSNSSTDGNGTDNKKLGGPRKYTSRLGQLVNSGRRTFNI